MDDINQRKSTPTTSPKMSSAAGRGQLQTQPSFSGEEHTVALVVSDVQSPKTTELLISCIEASLASWHLHPLEIIRYADLEYGSFKALSSFYNASAVIVDLTDPREREYLYYQLLLRKSFERQECIIVGYNLELNSIHQLTIASGFLVLPFKINEAETECILDGTPNNTIVKLGDTLREKLQNLLSTVHKRKRGPQIEELQQICREKTDDASKLGNLRYFWHDKLCTNVSLITKELLYNVILAFRDLQDFDEITSMFTMPGIRSLTEIKEDDGAKESFYACAAIRAQVAHALNRRHKEGDREAALAILDQVVSVEEKHREVADHLALMGRIYKDLFIESVEHKENKYEYLEKARHYYERAFTKFKTEHSAINIIIILNAFGGTVKSSKYPMIKEVSPFLFASFGRNGSISRQTRYWTVAHNFLLASLYKQYKEACAAANRLAELKPPRWYFKSLFKDLEIIAASNANSGVHRTESNTVLRTVYEFWVQYIRLAASSSDDNEQSTVAPVLLREQITDEHLTSKVAYQPCWLFVHTDASSVTIENVCGEQPIDSLGERLQGVSSKFSYPGALIRKVLDNEEDESSLYLYADTSDFLFYFPSANLCKQFANHLSSIQKDAPGGTPTVAPIQDLRFKYEEDKKDGYDGKKLLGQGSFGRVYSGMFLQNLRLKIAIKEVQYRSVEDLQPLEEEIKMHRGWKCKHIVSCFGCEVDKEKRIFRIFLEQVPGGSLSDLLQKTWGPLGDNDTLVANYTSQILDGLLYLHSQKVVHRDVKGSNVLVNQYSGLLLLTDFGTSRRLVGLQQSLETTAGTLAFCAPEVLNNQRGYGLKADIWSLGCTVIEMIDGKPPFHEMEPYAAAYKVAETRQHPDLPELASDPCKAFLLECFQPEPEQRPDAAGLTRLPFIANYRNHSAVHRTGHTMSLKGAPTKHHERLRRSNSLSDFDESPNLSPTNLELPSRTFTGSSRQFSIPATVEKHDNEQDSDGHDSRSSDVSLDFRRQISELQLDHKHEFDKAYDVAVRKVMQAFVRVLKQHAEDIRKAWVYYMQTAQLLRASSYEEVLNPAMLQDIFDSLVCMLTDMSFKTPDTLCQLFENAGEEELDGYQIALTSFDTVVLEFCKNQRLFHDIEPHSTFVISQNVSRVARQARFEIKVMNERRNELSLAPTPSRSPGIRKVHSMESDAQSEQVAVSPQPLSNRKRGLVRAKTVETPRHHTLSRVNSLHPTPEETTVTFSDTVYARVSDADEESEGSVRAHRASLNSDVGELEGFGSMTSEVANAFKEFVEAQTRVAHNFHSHVAELQNAVRMITQMANLGSDFNTPPRAVGTIDMSLEAFLVKCGVSEDSRYRLHGQELTLPLMLQCVELRDLERYVPILGQRLRLWQKIQQERLTRIAEA